MKREASLPRADFVAEAQAIGFEFAAADGEAYWDESVRYVFTLAQIEDHLEAATAELHALCLELVDRVAADDRLKARLGFPPTAFAMISESWRRRDPSLYGRFDFSYDGRRPPKLLEYNADTPTSLFEASVVQWRWLEQLVARGELPADADQFNSLHEKLIARWRTIGAGATLHLACMMQSLEDRGTLAYLQDCATQAGLVTRARDMADIGLSAGVFVDPDSSPIRRLFKLYPWEWLLADRFGREPAMRAVRFIEPAWKMILSCKGMLVLLWEMAPGHPNLLPAYFEDDRSAPPLGRYARKPLFSREGADTSLIGAGGRVDGPKGGYGVEGFIRQELAPLPDFSGRYPAIGSWVVGDEPAGMGIREGDGLITTNRARFIPHAIIG